MKKINILIFLLISVIGCGKNTLTNTERVNPTPKPVPTKSTLAIVKNTGPTNEPFITPVPVNPINLQDFTFKLEIVYPGTLGRVYVDDGELRSLPTTYTLRGGNHVIYIIDLITRCRIVKELQLDKDIKLEYKEIEICNFH
mgnify:CR=1 FL=1